MASTRKGHCLVHVHMLHYLRVGLRITITQSHTHTMQQTRTPKAVTQHVEAKKLLSRRNQSEYSYDTLYDEYVWQIEKEFNFKKKIAFRWKWRQVFQGACKSAILIKITIHSRGIGQVQHHPQLFPKSLIFIPLEVLAWVMIACWVLHSRLTYFWRNMNISSIFYFSESTSINTQCSSLCLLNLYQTHLLVQQEERMLKVTLEAYQTKVTSILQLYAQCIAIFLWINSDVTVASSTETL